MEKYVNVGPGYRGRREAEGRLREVTRDQALCVEIHEGSICRA